MANPSLIVTVGANIDNFVKNMEKVNGKVTRFGADLQKTGQSLTTGITLPLAALGGGAAKAAIEFESAFAGVRKTVNGTEEEFAGLRKGMIEMSERMPAAATEIARVGEAAGQLGIEKANILAFTETMIKLGTATNLSAEEAATGLARFANITQLPQDQVSNLGSTIVALGNNLATTEAEILEFGLRIAGAGSQVGLSEAQILAFGGALSSVGISAEAGGTAISKVFIEMASAVAEGGDKLDRFAAVSGVTAAQFQQQFGQDAAGTMVTFIEGLGKISEQGGNTFGVLDELGLSEIRVRDAMLRASGAGDLLRTSLELGTKAFSENNALNKEAEERYKTTESQMAMAWNQVKALAIEFGTALTPMIIEFIAVAKDLLVPVKEWISKFQALDAETKENYIKVALLVAAIGPLLMIAGKLITTVTSAVHLFGLFGKSLSAATTVIKGVDTSITAAKFAMDAYKGGAATASEAMKHFSTQGGLLGKIAGAMTSAVGLLSKAMAFLAANPIIAVIAVVAALAAGLIYLWKTNEDFRNAVKGIWESIWGFISPIIDKIGGAINLVVDKFNAVKGAISGTKMQADAELNFKANTMPDIPGFATGGMVPGPIGSPMLAMVHGGEEVLTPEQQRTRGSSSSGMQTPIYIQLGGHIIADLVVEGTVVAVRTGRINPVVLG